MAEIKITSLAAITDPASTDVLPIVDVSADITNKISIADLLKNATTGSASSPSFAFDGDSNTGMYRSDADELAFSTGGTGRLFIDSSGNVGVGTASPADKLHVVGNGRFNDGTNGAVQLGSSSDVRIAGGSSYGGLRYYTNNGHAWYNGSTELMKIDSSGRLLVGVSSSIETNSQLQVVGENVNGSIIIARDDTSVSNNQAIGRIQYYGNDDNGTYQLCAAIDAAADGDHATGDKPTRLVFSTTADSASSPTERMRIDSSGNVGIGTLSPTGYIHIEGESTGTETYGRFTTGPAAGDQSLEIKSGTSRDHMAIQVKTNAGAVDDLSLQPDGGNVGIGTSSPGYQLDVKSSGTGQFFINGQNSSGNNIFQVYESSAGDGQNGMLYLYDGAGNTDVKLSTNGASYFNGGNVGIGTSSPEGVGLDVSSSRTTNYSSTTDQRSLAHIIARNGSDAASRFSSISLVNGGSTQAEASINLIQAGSYVGHLAFKCRSGSSSWAERMRIDSSGRLLVGTTTAGIAGADNLTLGEGTTAAGLSIRSGTSNTGNIFFSDGTSSNAQYRGYVQYNHTDDALILGTTASDRLRIDSSGVIKHIGSNNTDETNKLARYVVPSHDTNEEDVLVFQVENESSFNQITFGGGTSSYNAATQILFRTASAVDTTTGVERMRIDSSGNVGIGGAGTNGKFYVSGFNSQSVLDQTFYMDAGGSYPVQIALANGYGAKQGITFLNNGSSSYTSFGIISENTGLSFKTAAYNVGNGSDLAANWTDRIRMDSSGNLLIGTSNARTDFFNSASSYTPALQVETTANESRFISLIYNSNNTNQPHFVLGKTRGTSNGSNTVVQSGDNLGSISFMGADGSELVEAARIQVNSDNTPGANDMPGRIEFHTTANSQSSPVERARFYSTGEFHVGNINTPSGYHRFVADSTIDNYGALLVNNVDTAAAACVAAFVTATNSTATSNVLIKFGINAYSEGSGQINANGSQQAAFGSFSDRRLKENIVDLPSQWQNIKSLKPKEFDYLASAGGGHQVGFIAQEMQTVYPDAVGSSPMFVGPEETSTEERLTLTGWGKTDAYLVKALQEAMERIETLEQRLTDAGL